MQAEFKFVWDEKDIRKAIDYMKNPLFIKAFVVGLQHGLAGNFISKEIMEEIMGKPKEKEVEDELMPLITDTRNILMIGCRKISGIRSGTVHNFEGDELKSVTLNDGCTVSIGSLRASLIFDTGKSDSDKWNVRIIYETKDEKGEVFKEIQI